MIGSDLLSFSYGLVNKAEATFLDGSTTTFYKRLNTLYGHRVLDILRVRVDKNATINEATTDLISTVGLVAGDNGFGGEFAFPADLLKPVRFEVSYDGITWIKCNVYDNALNERSEYNDVQLASDFSQSDPRVDFTRNSYKIRPPKTTAGNITKGIYIEYEQRQVDFTSTTAPVQIEANLQDILAWDLAKLEIIMHSKNYTSQEITVFNQEHQKAEDRFLEFYKNNLPTRKKMTLKYQNYR